MTVEEIEIIVTAKVEEALKNFDKLVPAFKEKIKELQNAMSQIDTKQVQNKVSQAVHFVQKKVQDVKKSIENNKINIKVNNTEAKQQVTQLEKEIDSLQKKISGKQLKLDIVNNSLDKIRYDTNQSVIKEMPDAGNKRITAETYARLDNDNNYNSLIGQSDKLNNEIIKYNDLLNSAKSKMAQLGQSTSKTSSFLGKFSSFFSSFVKSVGKATTPIKQIGQAFSNIGKIGQNLLQKESGFGKGLKSGLSHVMRYAMALFSLRTIYSAISNSAQAWLSSQNAGAQQLSANINYMKYAMGSVFAPVIQYVTNLIYQLMRAIQSVVYALFRVNIFAKASAQSMKGVASGAKQAKNESKSLASVHSEINNIGGQESTGGSGGSGSIAPNIDLSKMNNTPNSIIDAIKKGNWYEVGAILGQKLNEAMNSIPWDKIQSTARKIGAGIAQALNGFIGTTDWKKVGNTFAQAINTILYAGQLFVKTFDFSNFGKSIGTSLSSSIENIDWKALGDTLSSGIKGIFDTISGFFKTFDWSFVVNGLLDFISGFDWNGVSDAIFKALGSACASLVNLGMIIGEKINEALDKAKEFFKEKIEECGGNIVEGIFKGIIEGLENIGQWIIDHIFKPFIDGFKDVFGIHSPSTVMTEQGKFIMQGLLNGISSLVDNVRQIWENIKNTAIQKFTDIKNSISNIWQQVFNKTSEIWQGIKNKVKEGAQGARNGITSIFGNIPNWFRDKFSQAWQNVKNVFSTGGRIFDGIKDGILSGLKAIVNAIISGMNKVVSIPFNGLNSALKRIRNSEILGLKPFNWISTIQVPQIPRLAKGNVAYEETLAIFGEYSNARNNPEITTPQNVMRETFEDVLSNRGASSGQSIHLTVNYLGKNIFDDTIEYINEKTRRTNKNTIIQVEGG